MKKLLIILCLFFSGCDCCSNAKVEGKPEFLIQIGQCNLYRVNLTNGHSVYSTICPKNNTTNYEETEGKTTVMKTVETADE